MVPTLLFLNQAQAAVWALDEPPPEPELVFLDQYDGSNDTPLDEHLSDVPGSTYTDTGAALMTIQDGNASAFAAGSSIAAVDIGISDYTLVANITGPSDAHVVIRYLDAANYWFVTLTEDGIVRITKVETGSPSVVAESGLNTFSYPTSIVITCNGMDIVAEAVGAVEMYDESDFAMSATQVGLKGGDYLCDSLVAYTLPG